MRFTTSAREENPIATIPKKIAAKARMPGT
jgi:hypothetical protein